MRNNESSENYLETILILSKKLPVVRSVDIANELGFKKSSVSIAMKNLKMCIRDRLHCALSSGISGTVNSARLAKEALEEEYPDRTVSYTHLDVYKRQPISNQFKEFIGMYRWLSREFTTVECTRTCE